MRPHFILLLSLALVSCVDGGTGGYAPPPEAAAWNAYGTATAAVVQVTGTAVSQQATYTAAYAQATVQAQNTAVSQTATAAPAVTEAAELQSVAAVATATMAAIMQNRAQVESEATAVYIRAQMDAERARGENYTNAAKLRPYVPYVAFVVMLAIVAYAAIHAVNVAYYRGLPGVFAADGTLLATRPNWRHIAPPPPPIDIQDVQEPPPSEHVYETLVNAPGGSFTVLSPTPGDYVNWLAAVLDNPRVEFSNNERRRRGWQETHFWRMIGDMKRVGWLFNRPDARGCYTMTDTGKAQARAWLSPPPPGE